MRWFYSRVKVSSMFKIPRLTVVHAANFIRFKPAGMSDSPWLSQASIASLSLEK
ncbi:hypothetical protein OAH08_05290 [Verrucomicrobia bacterium]|nr:hypothetical protein [Verrucomicrobiota bacterium]